jgi:hypothetical protein
MKPGKNYTGSFLGKTPLSVLILVGFFLALSLYKMWSQEVRITQLTYELDSINNQPEITIVGTPVVEQIWSDSFRVETGMLSSSVEDSVDIPRNQAAGSISD